MGPFALFLNDAGRLRSGWRLGAFIVLYAALFFLAGSVVRFAYAVSVLFSLTPSHFFEDVVFRMVLLVPAILAGWICNRWIEGLPGHDDGQQA